MSQSPGMRWLFGLDAIPIGADGLQLSWQHPLAVWGWLLIILGAIGVAVWSYRWIVGARSTRVALATTRALLLIVLVALAAGPLLRLPIIETQPDWIAVLVDRSRSMSVEDTRGSDGKLQSRDLVARALLNESVWSEIAKDKEIVWLGFHTSAFDLDPQQPTSADGWSTDLTVPTESALRRLAGRPASGIVILSDGRTTRPLDRTVLRALQSRAVPVFVVPLGSAEAMTDLGIAQTDAPNRAFIRDQVPIVATLQCAGGIPRTTIQVDLVDVESGDVLNTIEVEPSEFINQRCEAVLTGVRSEAGSAHWLIRVRAGPDDLVRTNDQQAVEVEFVDRPLRLLYIEGYPRWEYRYLKNLLVRESSFESSVMLLSADRDFAQEGNAPLERLPQSDEEFASYDLFILGDVPAGSLSETQIEQIRRAVSERGAGLLWIGGERSTPHSWRATQLEDLLPMRGVPERFDEAIYIEPTESALRAGVMRLGESAKEKWPIALSPTGERGRLEWAQRVDPESLKPAAEVLARGRPLSGGASFPVAISMRYGAGLVLYVATDETWRWRHGIGETYQERFWIQFIRYLSRGAVQSDGNAFRLVVEPKRPEVAMPAMIRVEIQDSKAGDIAGSETIDAELELIDTKQSRVSQSTQLVREGDAWVGLWSPETQGQWRVRVDSSHTGSLERIVEVVRTDSELTHPESDHAQLIDLATRTGGAVVQPNDLASLAEMLPKRSLNREQSIVDPLWNSPAALILVLFLLSIEWIGRKWLRLA
ncbi:MAG: hypothetical protein EXS17_04820 [Phycisphaerales bacterium]|nr:hypothetical protein [Phycisphaerales bacterium]